MWESQQVWPSISAFLIPQLLRNPGDRMRTVPATCLVFQLLSIPQHADYSFNTHIQFLTQQQASNFSICENSWESHSIVAWILRFFLLQQAYNSTQQSWRRRGIHTHCRPHFSIFLSTKLRICMQACVYFNDQRMDHWLRHIGEVSGDVRLLVSEILQHLSHGDMAFFLFCGTCIATICQGSDLIRVKILVCVIIVKLSKSPVAVHVRCQARSNPKHMPNADGEDTIRSKCHK